MPSTVIRGYEYHPDRRELELLFTTGRRYLYADVPAEVAKGFGSAFAKGIYFNRHIRGRYDCREVGPVSDESPPGRLDVTSR